MFRSRMFPGTAGFDQLRQEMNRLLDGVSSMAPTGLLGRRSFPALNVWEDGECLYAEAEIPGLTMDEIGVHIAGNELIIKGEFKELEDESMTYHRRERGTGTFARSLVLPIDVAPEKIEAALKNGVLTITMPKAAAAMARKITVQSD